MTSVNFGPFWTPTPPPCQSKSVFGGPPPTPSNTDIIYKYNKMLNHGLAVQVLMFTGSQDSVIFIYDGFLTTFSEVQEWGWEKKGRNIDIFVTSSLKW